MKHLALLFVLFAASFVNAAPLKFAANGFPARDSIINGKRDWPNKITATDVNPLAGLIWRYDVKKLGVVSMSETEKYFIGPPGTYQIEVWSVVLDPKTGKTTVDSATVVLNIAPAVDDPVIPPGPGPIPPKPVDPVVPTDPLTRALQDAYNQDKEPDKAAHKTTLASTFRSAKEDVLLNAAKSTAALFDAMEAANKAAGNTGKIMATKAAAATYLKDKIPGIDYPLTTAKKATIKTEFTKIADALDAVK